MQYRINLKIITIILHGLLSFAPYDDPQIVVVSLIFQGGHGGYAAPITREVIAEYLGLNEDDQTIKLI